MNHHRKKSRAPLAFWIFSVCLWLAYSYVMYWSHNA